MLGGAPPYDRRRPRSTTSPPRRFTCRTVPGSRRIPASAPISTIRARQRMRMKGVTPPHIYTLKPREALFHGVPALRLTPIGGEGDLRPRRPARPHLHARAERRFQRLRLVQGLLRVP